MRLSISLTEWLVAAVVVGGIGIAAWQFLGAGAVGSAQRTDVRIPEFSLVASAGKGASGAKNPLRAKAPPGGRRERRMNSTIVNTRSYA